jgi:hypothetical protein
LIFLLHLKKQKDSNFKLEKDDLQKLITDIKRFYNWIYSKKHYWEDENLYAENRIITETINEFIETLTPEEKNDFALIWIDTELISQNDKPEFFHILLKLLNDLTKTQVESIEERLAQIILCKSRTEFSPSTIVHLIQWSKVPALTRTYLANKGKDTFEKDAELLVHGIVSGILFLHGSVSSFFGKNTVSGTLLLDESGSLFIRKYTDISKAIVIAASPYLRLIPITLKLPNHAAAMLNLYSDAQESGNIKYSELLHQLCEIAHQVVDRDHRNPATRKFYNTVKAIAPKPVLHENPAHAIK